MNKDRQRYEDWTDRHDVDPDKPLVPAATVVLLRDGAGGIEVLMMRRSSKLDFVGGMWVFPGGKVDPEDYPPAAPDDRYTASLHAAVREAEEEADLVVGADALVRYSHWVPPAIAPRRFATWFFVARAPEGPVTVDGGEIKDHAWWAPSEAMSRRAAGEIEFLPPTYVTLHELGEHATVDDALTAAADREPPFYETHIGVVDNGAVAMWEGDAGWETSTPDTPGPRHRLSMLDEAWTYESP